MGKVSIVIPHYNYQLFLKECVESAIRQTVSPIEIIIVDDYSTVPIDTDKELIRDLYRICKDINLIIITLDENCGLSAARNTGIKAAKGEYILCLDADDTIEPEFIEMTVDTDDIVATYQQEFGAREGKLRWLEHPVLKDFFQYNQIPAGCLFKKNIWERIGGYDESMKEGYEDWEMWMRALQDGATITTVPLFLFNYRIHPDSMINKTITNHERLKKYIMKKLHITK